MNNFRPDGAAQPMSGRASAAVAIYWLLVIAFIAYVWLAGQAHGAPPQWVAFWCIFAAGLLAIPRTPIAAPCIYVLLAYGMSSHGPVLDLMLSMRVLDGAALLILCGWLLTKPWLEERSRGERTLAMMGYVLFGWIAFCLVFALHRGIPYGTFLRHDPSGMLQAAVMLFVTAGVVKTRRDCIILTTTICATVIGRAALQGVAGIYLESYIATLLVIGVPMAVIGAKIVQNFGGRIVFGCVALAMVSLLALTQNRAAAVAAVAALITFFWQSRRAGLNKWLGAAVVVAGASLIISPNHYVDRFLALVSPSQDHAGAGLDRGTAQERLQLWSAGLEMAMERPITGVGPGNYPGTLEIYLPSKGMLSAHSNYVQMAAETGFVGLVLYAALFLSTLVLLTRIRGHAQIRWQQDAAQMLQLALIAYLAGGVFNSRHDFVLAYVLAGWAWALFRIHSSGSTP